MFPRQVYCYRTQLDPAVPPLTLVSPQTAVRRRTLRCHYANVANEAMNYRIVRDPHIVGGEP
jgi:hypothetical protein